MKRSMMYLGEPVTYETERSRGSASSLDSLHRAGQRVAWAIMMGDRVGLDLEDEVRRMLARHADHFAAHFAAAIARRAQRRESEAERHIARARELVPAGHPWAKLVPNDLEWQAGPVEPKLEMDEPDRVYRVANENRRAGAPFGSVGVGRFLRMRSGEQLDFEHVASCHGSWRAVDGNARQELEQRLGWILELDRIRALRFLGDFVYRHPGVFFRFAKEMVAARRKKKPVRPESVAERG